MTGWIANFLQVIGLVLLGKKQRVGWLFGVAAECLWIVRAEAKDMPDLMFISVIYIAVAVINWSKWGKA